MQVDRDEFLLLFFMVTCAVISVMAFGIRRTTACVKKHLTDRGFKIRYTRGPYPPAFHSEYHGVLHKSQFAVIMHVEDKDGGRYQYHYAIGDMGFGLLFNVYSLLKISAD